MVDRDGGGGHRDAPRGSASRVDQYDTGQPFDQAGTRAAADRDELERGAESGPRGGQGTTGYEPFDRARARARGTEEARRTWALQQRGEDSQTDSPLGGTARRFHPDEQL